MRYPSVTVLRRAAAGVRRLSTRPRAEDAGSWELTLARSYWEVVGKELAPGLADSALYSTDAAARAHALLSEAPFCLLSHGTETPFPVLNYGNCAALEVFEVSWAQLIAMESRRTAPDRSTRQEREVLLARVRRDGYIDDYSGIRVSSTGRMFEIRDAVVWEVYSPEGGGRLGQAATFPRPSHDAYLQH